MYSTRLCRAIALAANAVNLSCTVTVIEGGNPVQKQRSYTILSAVLEALKNPSAGSLPAVDGFLALTDSIIYAIKVANPELEGLSAPDSQKLKKVSIAIFVNDRS
jgi:hypothetical protein